MTGPLPKNALLQRTGTYKNLRSVHEREVRWEVFKPCIHALAIADGFNICFREFDVVEDLGLIFSVGVGEDGEGIEDDAILIGGIGAELVGVEDVFGERGFLQERIECVLGELDCVKVGFGQELHEDIVFHVFGVPSVVES